jgi:hypothetical protein
LTELAQEALGLASPQASEYWKGRLLAIEETQCRELIEQIPDGYMSVEARTFCLELLMTNRGRLADGD